MTPPAHRVVLTFDDGVYAKLVCPDGGGCVGSEVCGICGRNLTDPESSPCYDCTDMDPGECWVKTWFDNCTAEELLRGELTVVIDATWTGDHMTAQIVEITKDGSHP